MKRSYAALISLILITVAAGVGYRIQSLDSLGFYREIISWIESQEGAKYWIFFLIFTAGPFVFVPVILLALTSGVLFGPILGTAIASSASLLSACLAFWAGRGFARSWVVRKIESRPKFRAVDRAVGKKGWKIVMLIRFSPFFPFGLMNLSLGTTKITLAHYAWATWLGMLPGLIVYSYLGSLLAGIVELTLSDRKISTWEWLLSIGGGAAMTALFFYLIQIAKKALSDEAK